ncbi:MAG: c-type cytochrome [Burkholderiaceae bacterium]
MALAGWGRERQDDTRADPNNAAQVTRGAAVYAQSCAACHGARLERQPNWRLPEPRLDDSGHAWPHADDVLFNINKRGLVPPLAPAGYQSDMPALRGQAER